MYQNRSVPKSLALIIETIYHPNKWVVIDCICDVESCRYEACSFLLNSKVIVFRSAHITPTKVGQFVTLWKRVKNGPIRPYDLTDSGDLVVISVQQKGNSGHFVFPKNILFEKGIISKRGMGGKRAMRLYPPWDCPTSKLGQKAQSWQLEYFLDAFPDVQDLFMKYGHL